MMQQNKSHYHAVLDNPTFRNGLNPYTIQVVALASGASLEKINALKTLPGLNLDFSNFLQNQETPFHAASDEQRLANLQDALYCTKENSLIWTLRGGYGSARLLTQLERLPPPPEEKFVIGFSDNTALHLFLTQHWNWKTIHGSGFAQLLDNQQDADNFLKLLPIINHQSPVSLLDDLKPMNQIALQSPRIQGKLTGGNLTLIQCSIGTSWQMNAQDKIVLIEEVNEQGYRIDRALLHLEQAKILHGCNAIILGDFIYKSQESAIHFALRRFADNISIPVYQSHQFGHGHTNYPLVLNALTEISQTEEGHFSLFAE